MGAFVRFEVYLYGKVIAEILGGLGDTEAGIRYDLVVNQGFDFGIIVKRRQRVRRGRKKK